MDDAKHKQLLDVFKLVSDELIRLNFKQGPATAAELGRIELHLAFIREILDPNRGLPNRP